MQRVIARKITATIIAVLLACTSAGLIVALNATSPSKAYAATKKNVKLPKGIAATVDGKKIKEKTVTAYVKKFRKAIDLTSKASWKEWLKENKYTPKKIRLEVIDYFVDKKLYDKAVKKYGIKVTKKEIKATLKEVKEVFGSDEVYQQLLDASGMTEKEYIEDVVKPTLLQTKLTAKLLEKGEIKSVDEKDFQKWFKKYKAKATIKIAKMPKGLPYAV